MLRDNERLLDEVRQREAALAHEVMHDGLTGLSNRAMLLQRLDQVVALHQRDGRGLVVMFCDLDGFKAVNDTLGHLAGDGVLREVAQRLRATVRTSDTVARPSGDEFALLMEPPHEDPLRVAGRLIDTLAGDIELPEGTVRTGVSIGIAVVPGRGDRARRSPRASLIAAADSAMYSAKSGGKNRAVLVEVGLPGTRGTRRRGRRGSRPAPGAAVLTSGPGRSLGRVAQAASRAARGAGAGHGAAATAIPTRVKARRRAT